MRAQVFVRLKPGVLDVQGKALEHSLHEIGFGQVSGVRVGKLIEFEISDSSSEEMQAEVKAMCDQLLANTVIESYEIKVLP